MDASQLVQRAQLVDPKYKPTAADEVVFEAIAKESAQVDSQATYTISSDTDNETAVVVKQNGLYAVYFFGIVTATTAGTGQGFLYVKFTSELGAAYEQAPGFNLNGNNYFGTVLVCDHTSATDPIYVGIRTVGFSTGSLTTKIRATLTKLR